MFAKERKQIIGFVKQSLDGLPLSEDLGDYIPFLAHYKEYDFCNEQIEESTNKMQWGMFYGDAFPKLRWARNAVIVPELNTDALLGLLLYHRQSRAKRPLDLAKNLADGMLKHCYSRGFVSALVSRLGPKAGFTRGMNGLYMELLPELYDATGKEKYLSAAEEMAKAWINIPFFKKHKLFPTAHFFSGQFLNNHWSDCWLTTVFKHSTSTLNGLLEVYRRTGNKEILDSMERWIESTEDSMTKGCINGKLNTRTGKLSEPYLLYNFPVIDFLCDFYAETRDKEALYFAEDLADFWIKKRSRLGLLPEGIGKNSTMIDSITDFSMSLFRLWELTKKVKYKNTGVQLVKANMKLHEKDVDKSFAFIGGRPLETRAFVDSVDYRTGKIVRKWVKPKFIALMLKPIIYLESGKKMYKNRHMRLLLRDR